MSQFNTQSMEDGLPVNGDAVVASPDIIDEALIEDEDVPIEQEEAPAQEDDLFGSDEEEEKAPVTAAPTAQPEEDLFGSDEETSSRPPAADELFGEDQEKAATMDEDLFGSDDEEDAKRKKEKDDENNLFGSSDEESSEEASGSTRRGSSTASTGSMNEQDLFGAASSDEEDQSKTELRQKRTMKINVSNRPRFSKFQNRKILKLPNVLSMDPRPFDKDTFDPDSKIAFREVMDMEKHRMIQLENAENYIRWRFRRDKDGQIVHTEDGRPMMESNARVVEYEDGSAYLFIGSEPFVIRSRPDRVHIFDDRKNLKVFQDIAHEQVTVTPVDLKSRTHNRLLHSQINKVKPQNKVILQLHGPEPETRRKELTGEAAAERRKRLLDAKQKKNPSVAAGLVQNMAMHAIGGVQPGKRRRAPSMSSDFDDDAAGVSLKKMRQQFRASQK